MNFPYKICIPYDDHAMGGMYTFFSYFRSYLDRNGIKHARKLWSRYDVLLINSFMTPLKKIRRAKLFHPGLRVVHRIDGSAEDYGRGAEWDSIQKDINSVVSLTFFQSQYGKYATREKFNVIAHDGPVIHNPVDTDLFKPDKERQAERERARVAFVSFSTNPRKGMKKVFGIAKANSQIDFVLAGRFENPPDLPNIIYKGHLGREEVAEMLGGCHFFVFFSENETCPNVVLEAMACGLPVLYLDSGGTKELVGETGIAVTVDSFSDGFMRIWSDWDNWSGRTRARAVEQYSIDRIIPQYLKAILDVK